MSIKTFVLGILFSVAVCTASVAAVTPTPAPTPTRKPKDTRPPSVPTGLKLTVVSCTYDYTTQSVRSLVHADWNASTDTGGSGLYNYRLYRSGTVKIIQAPSTFYDDTVNASSTYSYNISAMDIAGNESKKSSIVNVSTPGCGTSTPTPTPTSTTPTPTPIYTSTPTATPTATPTPTPDPTALTISNVSVSNITPTSATIFWTTNKGATDQALYGYDADVGFSTTKNNSLTMSHTQVITGLMASTAYYYRARSVDSSLNAVVTTETTFVTAPVNPNGAYDFHFSSLGPENVVKGHPLYVTLELGIISSSSSNNAHFTVSGLPANTTYSFPDLAASCCTAQGGEVYAYSPNNNVLMQISTTSSTPVGSYQFQVTAVSGSISHQITRSLIVNPVPAPISPLTINSVPAIPNLAAWQSHMTQSGQKWCDQTTIQQLGAADISVAYYDGERVYYQIADYTNNSSWNTCAGYVEDAYHTYVTDNNGAVAGWKVFAQGFFMDFDRNGDVRSKNDAILLATNSPYAGSGGNTYEAYSRETAYVIEAYLSARSLGQPRNPKLDRSLEYALGHLDQWTVAQNSPIKPFMVGLTAEALIKYYNEDTPDPRIPVAIKTAMDWLWANAWVPSAQSFWYVSTGDLTNYAPDLNLLIAPTFAWLYHMTGDPIYQQRGDQIFTGGVLLASVDYRGKIFSQNYRLSFDFVRWRTNP